MSTSQSKWNKAKLIVFGMIKIYIKCQGKEEPIFDFKSLEQSRGFLVHLAGTYPNIRPRLKGIHHTLESWRGNRDEDGWKIKDVECEGALMEGRRNENTGFQSNVHFTGTRVKAVSRLRYDLLALGNLFNTLAPPLRLVRGKKVYIVKYGFGDASGTGFGSSWLDKDGAISYRYGVWGSDGQTKSSNFRELCNLVETIELLASQDELSGVEMFIFTDNSVAEAAFYKGNSSSQLLFELILRLTIVETNMKCKFHIIHVAGTRMISQGSDGLSRGNMLEGVMKGDKMLSFVPLHKSAIDVQPNLELWIRSWLPFGDKAIMLKPEDWFERGHDIAGYAPNEDGISMPVTKKGTYIWAPPPAAADVAIQELRKARHKRQKSLHVFVCPRLMKPLWFKQVFKAADMIFDLATWTSLLVQGLS